MHKAETRRLTVRTVREPTCVAMEIADTGAGMASDVVKHVFEPFYTTKPVGVGTGLGLSVSYGIIQAHGGTIDVQSTLGAGTTFRITLPLES
jgi:two-component system NtrC family sensor kinase